MHAEVARDVPAPFQLEAARFVLALLDRIRGVVGVDDVDVVLRDLVSGQGEAHVAVGRLVPDAGLDLFAGTRLERLPDTFGRLGADEHPPRLPTPGVRREAGSEPAGE